MTDDSYIDTANKKVNRDDLPDWFDEDLFKKFVSHIAQFSINASRVYTFEYSFQTH